MNEQDGRSCLTWACEGGRLDIAKYLCELGGEEMLMRQSKVRMCVIYGWYHMHACTQRYAGHLALMCAISVAYACSLLKHPCLLFPVFISITAYIQSISMQTMAGP